MGRMSYRGNGFLLIFLLFLSFQTKLAAQSLFILSRHSDFSTDDRVFSHDDSLFMKIVAPEIDFTDIHKNEFRLQPDSDGDDIEGRFTNLMDGTYVAKLALSSTHSREDEWKWRARIEDQSGNKFEAEVDIKIMNGGDREDEVEIEGFVESLGGDFLVVHGTTIFVDAATVILDNHENPMAFSDLKVGDRVEVKAEPDANGNLVARQIEADDRDRDESEVKGKIESLGQDSLVVMGKTFFVNEATEIVDDDDHPLSFTDLAVGQIVEVRARMQQDGSLLASRIKVEGENDDGDDQVELTGTIESISDSALVVDGIEFFVTESTVILDDDHNPIPFADLTVGLKVEVRGERTDDGMVRATRIKVENAEMDNDEIEITGMVREVGDDHIAVDKFVFQVSEDTQILDDDEHPISLSDIQVGFIVEVRADVLADGTLLATRIKLEDRFDDELNITGEIESLGDSTLVVSGFTFEVTPTTLISDDNDNVIDFATLTVGLLVEIRAGVMFDGTLQATKIKIEDRFEDEVELTGTIESLAGDNLVVAGMTFFVDANTNILDNSENPISFADLMVGHVVEIDAKRQADGRLLATRIQVEDRLEDEIEVTGAIQEVSESSITVLDRTFVITEHTAIWDTNNSPISLSDLSVGLIVEVRADLLADGTLVAIRIKIKNQAAHEIEVAGPIEFLGPDALDVLGIHFLITQNTEVLDHDNNPIAFSDLAEGQNVQVHALLQPDGTYLATRIKVEAAVLLSATIGQLNSNSFVLLDKNVLTDANTLILEKQNRFLTFADLQVGQFVQVRAEQLDSGTLQATKVKVQSANSVSGIGSNQPDGSQVPEGFILHQNFPNPFNPMTTIRFEIPNSVNGQVSTRLIIYNLLGQVVRTLLDEPLAAGTYQQQWDGKDDHGNLLSSGVYLYQMKIGNLTQTKRLVLVK